MTPYLVWIENQLLSGQFSPDFYNNYIFTSVKEGLIGDITPKDWTVSGDVKKNVLALIEFPNGHRWRLEILNEASTNKRYNFTCSAKRYTQPI